MNGVGEANRLNETGWGRVSRILEDVRENIPGRCGSERASGLGAFGTVFPFAERSKNARNRNRDTGEIAS